MGVADWNPASSSRDEDASTVQNGHQIVAVVHCPSRASETWHREDGAKRFYIRASNATEELTGRSLVMYTRERWPE